MEQTFLIDAFRLLAVNDGLQNLLKEPTTLRLDTNVDGVFGGDEVNFNENDSVFFINGSDEPLNANEISFLRVQFQEGGIERESVFFILDLEESDGSGSPEGFIALVDGDDTLDGLPFDTDLSAFFQNVDATLTFAPPGFGERDAVSWAIFDSATNITSQNPGSIAYTIDALSISFGPSDQPIVEGKVDLLFESNEIGLLAGLENPLNDDITGRLTNASTGEILSTDVFGFLSYTISDGGGEQSGVYLALDTDDGDGGFLIFVDGTPLPTLAPGTDLDAFVQGASGTIQEPATGFESNNTFVAFESFGDISSDGTLTVTAAQEVAYLYGGAFDREPDIFGLNFWIDQAEAGLNLFQIAFFMTTEPGGEFEQLYGELDSLPIDDYVEQLYINTLDRVPEGAGFDFWVDSLEAGLPRHHAVVYFTESVEYQNNNDDLIETLTETSPGTWEFV
ncbi:MAG: DUF4214 domain-containing protein [Pseudomonadota bacterium]